MAADKGYDNNRVMDETRERGVVPIFCLRKGRPIPLTPIPYGTDEWKRLHRGRSAVEREGTRRTLPRVWRRMSARTFC
jgi:IS5 family transposase